jgi:anti-anti-sigma factor
MFTHTIQRVGDVVCLALVGEVDVFDRARLRDAVADAMAGRPVVLRVDVGGVDFIDCAAVATLLELRGAAAAAGTRLVVTGQRDVVQHLLLLLGLLGVLTDPPRAFGSVRARRRCTTATTSGRRRPAAGPPGRRGPHRPGGR